MNANDWMNRPGSNFYTTGTYLSITTSEQKSLKHLKSDKIKSGYVDTISIWRKEDNNHIDIRRLATILHFFFKQVEIPEDFIEKHNMKPYHLALINRLYIEYDDYDEEYATMGFKRPYGNSDVLGDVFEEYVSTTGHYPFDEKELPEDTEPDDYAYDWRDKNHDFLINIHNEVMDFMDLMLNELSLKFLEWESDNKPGTFSFQANWVPTQRAKRESKLNRILK